MKLKTDSIQAALFAIIIFFIPATGSTQTSSIKTETTNLTSKLGKEKTEQLEKLVGFWSNPSDGLFVSVHSMPYPEGDAFSAGKVFISLGGPPPKAGRADDGFEVQSAIVEDGYVTLFGRWGWDNDRTRSLVKLRVAWRVSAIKLEILEDQGYRHKNGLRLLKKRKE